MASSSIDGEVSRSSQKRKQLPGSPRSAAMASFSPNGAGSSSGKKLQQVTGAEEKNPDNIKSKNTVLEEVEREEKEVEEDDEVDREEEEVEEDDLEPEEEEIEEVYRDLGTLNGIQTRVWMDDTDILSCPVCYCALDPPIHQCPNGHVVCSSCWVLLPGKCSFCSESMGIIRCLALERVIESAKIRCPNARYGCYANLSYLHRAKHQKSCIYRPCSCPVSSCSFEGSTAFLSQHFMDSHKNSAIKFSYRRWFRVSVRHRLSSLSLMLDSFFYC